MEKKFSRVRSTRDTVLSAVLIIAGIACVATPTPISINILGCFITLFGLVLMFMLKSERKDTDTGLRYHEITKYFSSDKKADILKALETDPASFNWSETDSAEGIKLDIYYNKSRGTVFVQCAQYIPYEYIPCSDWYELQLDHTGNLTIQD